MIALEGATLLLVVMTHVNAMTSASSGFKLLFTSSLKEHDRFPVSFDRPVPTWLRGTLVSTAPTWLRHAGESNMYMYLKGMGSSAPKGKKLRISVFPNEKRFMDGWGWGVGVGSGARVENLKHSVYARNKLMTSFIR